MGSTRPKVPGGHFCECCHSSVFIKSSELYSQTSLLLPSCAARLLALSQVDWMLNCFGQLIEYK